MKKLMTIAAVWVAVMCAGIAGAQPAPETLRQTIRDHIANQEKLQGAFGIVDTRTGELRRLELVRVHERVGKTGDYYYSCTDMKDVKTGDILDLDFDIEDQKGALRVAAIRIHKDNAVPRYTYDENDNLIPVYTAWIKPTKEGSPISGKAMFTQTKEGLKVEVEIAGVSPGKHGFHIHEKGDCSDGGNAAGGHFNPEGLPHGDLLRDGIARAHAGDFGNIEIGLDGKGKLEKIFPGLTFDTGKHGVAGRSVILHEKEDDFGQPTGNAGGRIACGIIPSE